MDNVNKQVVEFFKSIGFTLIEIKSSVFRTEESTWVFQTDHKDHSVDASTILYEDAEKIYQDRNQAYTSLVEGIEGMKTDERKVATFGEWQAETYEDKMLVNAILTDILENVVKPLYGKTGDN